MNNTIRWNRLLWAAAALVASARSALAGRVTGTATTEAAEQVPAGNPELGVLIIVGIVGFLILVAWIFSRVSDDSGGRGSDRTLL